MDQAHAKMASADDFCVNCFGTDAHLARIADDLGIMVDSFFNHMADGFILGE